MLLLSEKKIEFILKITPKQSLFRTLSLALLTIHFLVACAHPREPIEIVKAFVAAIDSEKLDAAYKFLPDEFIVGYGGGEENLVNKSDARILAEKMFKDYNFELEASNFQMEGDQVFFAISIAESKDGKSANCTCEATVTGGLISRIIILFCNES